MADFGGAKTEIVGISESADGTTVIFPLPEEISFDSSYNWERFDSGLIGLGVEASRSGADFATLMNSTMARAAQGAAGGIVDYRNSIRLNTGNSAASMPAPKEEILFRGVTLREFSLSFNIASKKSSDMLAIMGKLNQFYSKSAPKFTDDSFFFRFPTLWKLSIVDGDRQIIKEREVAVKRINTILNPDGPFTTYTNGAPLHIRVSVDFIETTVPNEDDDANIFGI